MIWTLSRILIFLSICSVVMTNPDRPVDCRKFVFAPLCRGVAAKRGNLENGYMTPAIYVNPKAFKELLKNLYLETRMPRGDDEEEDYSRAIKKFQRQRDDGLFKLLQENKRFNSETENVLAQEYENL